uniref:Uncharacterized protein n=1 Tax=Globodera rostochiensis TaxID=31243 RepID=A0A914H0M5_GLORO
MSGERGVAKDRGPPRLNLYKTSQIIAQLPRDPPPEFNDDDEEEQGQNEKGGKYSRRARRHRPFPPPPPAPVPFSSLELLPLPSSSKSRQDYPPSLRPPTSASFLPSRTPPDTLSTTDG